MAICRCRECGSRISTEAPSCPQCGAPEPAPPPKPVDRATRWMISAALSLASILIAVIVIGNGRDPSTATDPRDDHSPARVPVGPATDAPIASAAHAEEFSPTPPGSQWSYRDTTDELNGTSEHFASVDSDNQLQFDFPYAGGSIGTLTVRRGKQFGSDVDVVVDKGQFICAIGEGCSIRVKFDDKPPQYFSAIGSKDGSMNVLFVHPYGRFISELKSSHTVLVELSFYQAGDQTFRFNTIGLNWDPFSCSNERLKCGGRAIETPF